MKEFFEEFQPRKLLGLTLVWPARIVYLAERLCRCVRSLQL